MSEQKLKPHWKTIVEISIRKDMLLNPGDRFAWFCWLGRPGDTGFKEYASLKTFTNVAELGKDLIKFLKLFIQKHGTSIDGYKFTTSKVEGIINENDIKTIKAIKNEIVGLIHCNLESDI